MASKVQVAKAVDAGMKSAIAAGSGRRERGDLAVAVRYDPRRRRLHLELLSGSAVAVPVDRVQGLSGAKPAQLKAVLINGKGYGLHWPALDVDVSVPELIAGCLGSKAWMSALARHAGRSTSTAKAAASRENGRKGGRPRKVPSSGDVGVSPAKPAHNLETTR